MGVDSDAPVCCGRTMRAIGVQREGVQLNSCPECGRHAWRAQGQELTREQLLEVLGDVLPGGPSAAKKPVSTGEVLAPDDAGEMTAGKRAELQEMLRGFTVHGKTS